MFRNLIQFLALVVQPRPRSFYIPPSASEPFYYYNTASHNNISCSVSRISHEPSFTSLVSSVSVGALKYWASRSSLEINQMSTGAFSTTESKPGENGDEQARDLRAFARPLASFRRQIRTKLDSSQRLIRPHGPFSTKRTSQITTTTRLRRSKGNISSIQKVKNHTPSVDAYPFSPSKIPRFSIDSADADYINQALDARAFSRPAFQLSPIMEDFDKNRYPVCSSASNHSGSLYSEEDIYLHMTDRASGVFIKSVCKSNRSPVLAEDFDFYDLNTSYMLSPYHGRQSSDEENSRDVQGETLPSMMLTLPTPEIPTSPFLEKQPSLYWRHTSDGRGYGQLQTRLDPHITREDPDAGNRMVNLLNAPEAIPSRLKIGSDENCDDNDELEKEMTGSPNQILEACSMGPCLVEVGAALGSAGGTHNNFFAEDVGPAKTRRKTLWTKFRTFFRFSL